MNLRFALILVGVASALAADGDKNKAPKIWDENALKDWATPITGVNARPNHYTEAEYYAAPVDDLRTYPVYHPDFEPAGYLDSIRNRGAKVMIEQGKARTKAEWITAGSLVWDELDVPLVRTSDARIIDFFRSREALKKYPVRIDKGGRLIDFRWVVEKDGGLKLTSRECAACHTQLLPDGTIIRGGQAHFPPPPTPPMVGMLFSAFSVPKEIGGELSSPGEGLYAQFGVPWLADDIHKNMLTMPIPEAAKLGDADTPGTIARFNGSPYWTTKIPSLISVRYNRYLDATGTHKNRGPEDIARYAVLVGVADDGSIGPYKFFTDYQRKLRFRSSDDALYALGMFITYGLEEPKNPNQVDALSGRGAQVFQRSGCAGCHSGSDYSNGMLIAADGFVPPDGELSKGLNIMRGMKIGTDTGLALKTRKGTGFYKVPSLRGLWHRTFIEHSGSIASLEEWFGRERLRADYVPGGRKGPLGDKHAVPGHEFGLDLGVEDKRALIAFLKTL